MKILSSRQDTVSVVITQSTLGHLHYTSLRQTPLMVMDGGQAPSYCCTTGYRWTLGEREPCLQLCVHWCIRWAPMTSSNPKAIRVPWSKPEGHKQHVKQKWETRFMGKGRWIEEGEASEKWHENNHNALNKLHNCPITSWINKKHWAKLAWGRWLSSIIRTWVWPQKWKYF